MSQSQAWARPGAATACQNGFCTWHASMVTNQEDQKLINAYLESAKKQPNLLAGQEDESESNRDVAINLAKAMPSLASYIWGLGRKGVVTVGGEQVCGKAFKLQQGCFDNQPRKFPMSCTMECHYGRPTCYTRFDFGGGEQEWVVVGRRVLGHVLPFQLSHWNMSHINTCARAQLSKTSSYAPHPTKQ